VGLTILSFYSQENPTILNSTKKLLIPMKGREVITRGTTLIATKKLPA